MSYGKKSESKRGSPLFVAAATLILVAVASAPTRSIADEGGISFWLPGSFGSLAAVPVTPGWAFGTFYYHTSVSAGADVATAREIETGKLNPTLKVNLSANLNANVDF